MTNLLQIGLSNALVAMAFAVCVAIVARRLKYPAWAHALWVLVLLKLVTPPLFGLPYWPLSHDVEATVTAAADTVVEASSEFDSPIVATEPPVDNTNLQPAFTAVANEPLGPVSRAEKPIAEQPNPQSPTGFSQLNASWTWIVTYGASYAALIWLAGSVMRLLYVARGLLLFRRWLGIARPAPERVVTLLRPVAERLGLSRQPQVFVLPRVVTPMVWALGSRAKLLLPEQLLRYVDDDELSTLLAHELAHIRRGDLWVRVLELTTSVLFWWHPVVWWARRRIREAEEEACDAWVVWALSAHTESYAQAMLKTVDFLCNDRTRLAPFAAGIGEGPMLKRRLRNIIEANTPRTLSQRGRLSVVLLATMLLPLGLISAGGQAEQETVNDAVAAGTENIAPAQANNELTAKLLGFMRLTDDTVTKWGADGSPVELPDVDKERLKPGETIAAFRIPKDRKVQGYFLKASSMLEFPQIWRSTEDATLVLCQIDHPLGRRFGNLLLDLTGPGQRQHALPLTKPTFEGLYYRNVALQPGVSAKPYFGNRLHRSAIRQPQPTPDAHRVHLPNGVMVELLGVGRFVDGELQWWSPNGSEQAAVAGVLESDVEGYGTVIAAKVDGEHASWSAEWEVDGIRQRLTASDFAEPADIWVAHVDPASQFESGNLILSLTGGAGKIVQTVPLNKSEDGDSGEPEPDIIERITSVKSTGPESCQVRFVYDPPPVGSDFVGIDQMGKTVEPTGFGGDGRLTFSLAKVQLKAIAVQQRRSYEARFDNIALQPGHKTQVKTATKALSDEARAPRPRPAPPARVLVIGTVTDAKTGKPINEYRLVPGYDSGGRGNKFFDVRKSQLFGASSFAFEVVPPNFSRPAKIVQYLRIEALGYPAKIASVDPTQKPAIVDFQLSEEDGITGIVQGPGGEPLPDAKIVVCLTTRWTQISENNVRFGNPNTVAVMPDENGRFVIAKADSAFAVLAIHHDGYGLVPLADLTKRGKLVIEPWAKVAGLFKIGKQPAADETIEMRFEPMTQRSRGSNGNISLTYQTETDSTGRFEFPQVPGLEGRIGRRIILRRSNGGFTSTWAPSKNIFVKSGEEVTFDFGGHGRAITGRLVAPESYKKPIDFDWAGGNVWLQQETPYPPGMTDEEKRRWYEQWKKQPAGRAHWLAEHGHGFKIKPDGSFHVDDLPLGKYQLICTVRHPQKEGEFTPPRHLGAYSNEITITDDGGNSVIDLGNLEINLTDTKDE